MEPKIYEFEAVIEPVPDKGGAYVRFPYDIRKELGKGRVKADVIFDDQPYSGSIVNMGVKNEDGSVCYIIGIRKDIRNKIGKQPGDRVSVIVRVEEESFAGPAVSQSRKLWKCPKCGRTFKNRNQDHYCGEAPKTIEEYISRQPEQAQIYLRKINEAVKGALPDAVEKISWSMPTYWKKCNLIQFAAFKKHVGLYPGPEAVEAFADRLTEYKTSKGAIQFPYNKELPIELIGEIARWCGRDSKKG